MVTEFCFRGTFKVGARGGTDPHPRKNAGTQQWPTLARLPHAGNNFNKHDQKRRHRAMSSGIYLLFIKDNYQFKMLFVFHMYPFSVMSALKAGN